MAVAAAEVEAREIAFAKTMTDRDLDAFLSFISPEAIFFSGNEPLKGRDEIARVWTSYFEEASAPFSWHPDVTEVLESGNLALGSAPVREASGEEVGRFNSMACSSTFGKPKEYVEGNGVEPKTSLELSRSSRELRRRARVLKAKYPLRIRF